MSKREEKFRKSSEKNEATGLGLKYLVVLVTAAKVLGPNRSSFGFLWNERGFCICRTHVSVTVSEQMKISLL